MAQHLQATAAGTQQVADQRAAEITDAANHLRNLSKAQDFHDQRTEAVRQQAQARAQGTAATIQERTKATQKSEAAKRRTMRTKAELASGKKKPVVKKPGTAVKREPTATVHYNTAGAVTGYSKRQPVSTIANSSAPAPTSGKPKAATPKNSAAKKIR